MDSRLLCSHLRDVGLEFTSEHSVQHFVGVCAAMNDDTYLSFASDVTTFCMRLLEGKFPSSEDCKTIKFGHNDGTFVCKRREGDTIKLIAPDEVPSLQFLRDLEMREPQLMVGHIASLMKLKTAVRPRQASTSDKEKSFRSITEGFLGDQSYLDQLCAPDSDWRRLCHLFIKKMIKPYEARTCGYLPLSWVPEHAASRFMLPPADGDGFGRQTKPTRYTVPQELRVMHHPLVVDLYNHDPTGFVNRLFIGAEENPGVVLSDTPEILYKEDQPLQAIVFIPKNGGKQRVVTEPNTVLNSLSKHLAEVLTLIERRWRVSGVHPSHDATTKELSHILANRKDKNAICYSIDSSSFTDRLPYRLQRVVLEEMCKLNIISELDIQIMDVVANAPTLFDGRLVIRYGVGTPMGTFPSFPLANITNGLLACYAFMIGNSKHANDISFDKIPARVIGDDFVTWNDKIGLIYPNLLTKLGVETSPAKCLISPFALEICSKIVTANHVYSQRNLRLPEDEKKRYPTVESRFEYYSSLLSYYGKDSSIASEYADIKAFRKLMELPAPFGLGWYSDILDPSLLEFLSATGEGLRFHRDPVFTADTLEAVTQRRDHYPLLESTETTPNMVIDDRIYSIKQLDPGILARYDSIQYLMRVLWSNQYSLSEMSEIALQLETACDSLEHKLQTVQRDQKSQGSDYRIRESELPEGTDRFSIPVSVSASTYDTGLFLEERFKHIESRERKEDDDQYGQ